MNATPEDLVARAVASTRLSDFGPDGWQEGLERLSGAVATDMGGDTEAVQRVERLMEERLVKRLRVEDWYTSQGQEAGKPVEGPVAVFGLPRTGTTALHHLLSIDPRFRYLRQWEVMEPTPPPDIGTESSDPRRALQTDESDAQHIRRVDGPVEDGGVFELVFQHSELVLPVPTYTRWWRTANHAAALPYHERVLRMLHSSRPPTLWLLKHPNYVFLLPEVAAQYPGVKFVMTHRHPVEVLPSTCSVLFSSRKRRLPNAVLDPAQFGAEVLEHFRVAIQQAMAGRAEVGEDRFTDVGRTQLGGDAAGTAERIYDAIGMDVGDNLHRAQEKWGVENGPGSRGEHHYTADEFGLTTESIRAAFADYIDAFGEHF